MTKPGQGKRRGKSFEWEVSKLLSLLWTKNERDDIFCPTSASGGRATTRAKSGKKTAFQHSDLSFSDPVGKPLIDLWNIECKTGYQKKNKLSKKTGKKSVTRWDVLDIIDSRQNVPVLLDFWKQTKREANKTNRIPVLFFRRNNRSACVCFTEELFESLTKYYKYYFLKDYKNIFIKISLLKYRRLIILDLKEFLQYITLDFNKYIEKCIEGSWESGKIKPKLTLKRKTETKI